MSSPSQTPSRRRTSPRPRSINRVPVPPLHRTPSTSTSASTSDYPPARNLLAAPSTPPRPLRSSARSPPITPSRTPTSTPTFSRAVNTALPISPPRTGAGAGGHATPTRIRPEEVELTPITPRGSTRLQRHASESQPQSQSPFDDRHSIVVDTMPTLGEEDPFEYRFSGESGKQKTMTGYRFAGMSPTSPEFEETLGPAIEDLRRDLRPVSDYRRSIYPTQPIPASTLEQHPDLLPLPLQPEHPMATPIRPTFRGLFALSTRRDIVLDLLPAVLLAGAASVVQPFMSLVIGDLFQDFEDYPLITTAATSTQRDTLTSLTTTSCIKLLVAGGYAVLINYLKGVMWARHGETIVSRLREAVFVGVQNKPMEWFDLGMGLKDEDETSESIGAGGLMAKFTKETDDVRLGTSQAFGNAIQSFLTFALCFIVAMVKSPVLAIVTLSTIPLVVLVQIFTQVLSSPLYSVERQAFAQASTNVERATSAIATVKAHNAQSSEVSRFQSLVNNATGSLHRQAIVWGSSIGITDFLLLATFVVGFWYGAKVVRDGKATSADVMTTFWACLLAASYLQLVVPQLMLITKGKMSMASLRTVIQDGPSRTSGTPFSPTSPTSPTSTSKRGSGTVARTISIRRIRPTRCHGEFDLRNVSFAYPSRPDNPVLRDITLFLPPGETTFIVGGSGSGKSTIAQLLLRLYAPSGGEITLDNQALSYLDDDFTRQHIAAVQQGCILFDLSIHGNVAMGLAGSGPDPVTGVTRRPQDVTRDEVVEACKMAMIHDFIDSLPQGYETRLGTGGSALSGGQRQRLAIARARIRDPTVLILDEATSALDATSRVAVFGNMKRWRKNRTTIVITHDLSQIVSDDFVYVMKDGLVAEHGFRSDLMRRTPIHGQPLGVFASMAAEHAMEPLAPKIEDPHAWIDSEEMLEGEFAHDIPRPSSRPHTPSFSLRPGSVMYLDILEEYARGARFSALEERPPSTRPLSRAQRTLTWANEDLDEKLDSRRNFFASHRGSFVGPRASLYAGSRSSLVSASRNSLLVPGTPARISRLPSYDGALSTRQSVYGRTTPARNTEYDHRQKTLSQNLEDDLKGEDDVAVALPSEPVPAKLPGIFALLFQHLPSMPSKHLAVLGILGSIGHGVSTPVWSAFLTRLMQAVGTGGDSPGLTENALIVLAISAAQAIAYFLQEFCLNAVASHWTAKIRGDAYASVLSQDKAWFDEPENAPSRLVQILVKDADDMRALMSQVVAKFSVFVAMVGLGIIWAMIIQWRLTLVGVAMAPAFAIIIMVNEVLIGKAERRNKTKREALAKTFYESVANVRGIRSMALEGTFREKFLAEAIATEKTGKNAGYFLAIGTAAIAAIPLWAMALMNYAGLRFVLSNYMNYEHMLTVFNLVLFSLTFGTQALDFVPTIAKVKAAAGDFDRLYTLSSTTKESEGALRFPISGHVVFDHVAFIYPSLPDVPILTDVSFKLVPGECVAIVGPSGSGKSTIAALLQRLYSPTEGTVRMDKWDLSSADVKWLRNHIAVVSQSANLFDASVASNIAYGSDVPIGEIHRAAKAANLHDFIQGLPQGYDTHLGENASLISGGQAQRLQIARALVRRSNILILDECTSALDVDNQRAILDTIVKIKDTRTTVFITHSVEAMRRCDRVICLGEGRVAEEGSFDELVAWGGVFAQLMKTGEWE